MRTSGDRIERSTRPPLTIAPLHTSESRMMPRRPPGYSWANTVFTGGSWRGMVRRGHSRLYRLKNGSTPTRSMLAS